MNPLSRLTRLLVVLFALTSGIAEARDIYVDKNASNASDSNAGSSSAPLKTIQAAVNLTNAGDVVIVRAGTYTETAQKSGETYSGIHITRSGTQTAPIVIKSEVEGKAIIDQNFQAAGFALWAVHDVTISGFSITECDGGGVYMVHGMQHDRIVVDHNTITRCDGGTGSNVGGVFMAQCTGCTISHNRISNIRVGGQNYQNAAGIHGYDQEMSVIEYNDISDAFNGVYHKRSTGRKGLTIRRNVIHGTDRGIWYSISGAGDPPHIDQDVFENVFEKVGDCVLATVHETGSQSHGLKVRNNVFNGCGSAVSVRGMQDVSVQNNIFLNVGDAITTVEGSWKNDITVESNNLYYTDATFTLQLYSTSSQSIGSLTEWKSITSFGKGSLVADPRFVSSTDFHLQSTSPARLAGSDGRDLGVYPDGIGYVGPGGVSTPKPLPPSSVSVQ